MTPLQLAYTLNATPCFYLVAKHLNQRDINIYGLSNYLKQAEYFINQERELKEQGLGCNYDCAIEYPTLTNKAIKDYTNDVFFQEVLENTYMGAYEQALRAVDKIREREGIK